MLAVSRCLMLQCSAGSNGAPGLYMGVVVKLTCWLRKKPSTQAAPALLCICWLLRYGWMCVASWQAQVSGSPHIDNAPCPAPADRCHVWPGPWGLAARSEHQSPAHDLQAVQGRFVHGCRLYALSPGRQPCVPQIWVRHHHMHPGLFICDLQAAWGLFGLDPDEVRARLLPDVVAEQAEMFLINGDMQSNLYTSSRAMHSAILGLLQVRNQCKEFWHEAGARLQGGSGLLADGRLGSPAHFRS